MSEAGRKSSERERAVSGRGEIQSSGGRSGRGAIVEVTAMTCFVTKSSQDSVVL